MFIVWLYMFQDEKPVRNISQLCICSHLTNIYFTDSFFLIIIFIVIHGSAFVYYGL